MPETEQSMRTDRRPSRGWAIHVRRVKEEQRKEAERRKLTPFKFELGPKEYEILSATRDHAQVRLRRLSPWDLNYAEMRLEEVWATSRLEGVRPRTLNQRVDELLVKLRQRGNGWLLEPVITDDPRISIPRYRQVLGRLEGLLTTPSR